ncbi:hypothetical protein SEMRO_3120_G344180.1 [Seminavis robusta]|uniref:Uncharacterized protein n=1 Tax=Seminavis robusta TaxID=568900 RepID=A0A9N8F4Y4_9STRA|nr:hypothetical protein SEMRO_3120_G344180.1 [Seminavis robusta]|eukprot:Sro3120_g344180.1 n/a (239) ;mRNA; r:1903-2619
MGGINLHRLERLIDNEESSEEALPVPIRPVASFAKEDCEPVIDNDSGSDTKVPTEVPAEGSESSTSSLGSPVLDESRFAKIDGEIDEILGRPIKWGIMTQLPDKEESTEDTTTDNTTTDNTDEDSAEEEDTATENTTTDNTEEETVEEETVEEETVEEGTAEEATIQGDSTDENSTAKEDATNTEDEESPKKKQKTSESEDEANIHGDNDSDNDGNGEGNSYNETNGPILLSTGSWSY